MPEGRNSSIGLSNPVRPFRVITDFRLISRQNYTVTHKKIPDSNMRRYNFNNFSRSIYHVFFSIIQYFSLYLS